MKKTTLHSSLRQEVKHIIFSHIKENYPFELFGEDVTAKDVESHIDRLHDIDLVQYLIQIIEQKI